MNVFKSGGYYDTNVVKLVQYDYKTDRIIKEFEYNDEYIIPRALAVSDTTIYVYYDGSPAYIKKISMATGSIEREYSFPSLEDMSIFKRFLYYTQGGVDGDKVFKLNANDFSLIGSFNVPTWEGLICGIANREGESWISSRFDDQMIILNDEGEHIGVVDVNAKFAQLCFMENNLVIAKEDRVYIFEINN